MKQRKWRIQTARSAFTRANLSAIAQSHLLLLFIGLVGFPSLVNAASDIPPDAPSVPSNPEEGIYLRPSEPCPGELETVVTGLLRDLPTYGNLVAGRTVGRIPPPEWPFGSVLLVSQPEYKPIDLSSRTFGNLDSLDPDTQQVFFTTLERQYVREESVLLQHYHWLFLTPSDRGWQMVFMYSSVGPYPANRPASRPPTPPQDSTDGIIGQAVRLWLRDCRARSVYPVGSGETGR